MRSLARMQFNGEFDNKLGVIVKERVYQTQWDALMKFHRAIERGELPAEADVELLRDLFLGSAQSLVLFQQQELSDFKLARIVSILLLGATNSAGFD